MNEVSAAIVRWLEQKRRSDRLAAAILSVLALTSGAAVFALTALLVYFLLRMLCGAFGHFDSVPVRWLALAAFGVTAAIYVRLMKTWRHPLDLNLDPLGFWIFRDISSIGPRLILEGFEEVRRYGELGELNVGACARALAYLAAQDRAISWEELVRHCPQVPPTVLREQLSLLDGVLFLGEDASRVSLMDPFRLRLRWMLGPEWQRERDREREHERQQARQQSAGREQKSSRPKPKPKPAPQREATLEPTPVTDPEKLSPYDLLGVSPLASLLEIKTAYRKRIKECHPDLFAGMDAQSKALAERWTKAMNAAYCTLNPRGRT